MTQQLTPPPELVHQWFQKGNVPHVADKAAQWGADQELEACCEWVSQWTPRWPDGTRTEDKLRAARRPKPPSLKEQALALIDGCTDPEGDYLDDNALSIIRRALEQLND